MFTDRDIQVILQVALYYVLSRQQIQRLVFPEDKQGRLTRRRLQELVSGHFISRMKMLFCPPAGGAPMSVYFPTRTGCELLAQHFSDERFLSVGTTAPIQHHLHHWLAVSETHIMLDQALASDKAVTIGRWINEWDTVDKDAHEPDKKYTLYTLLSQSPRLVCVPDAAFMLKLGPHSKVFYLEQDMATSGCWQLANGKTGGYAEMFRQQWQRRHFPESTVEGFNVLMIAPTASRRDSLKKAFSEKPGSSLWWFASVEEFTADAAIYKPIWNLCDGTVRALVEGKK